MLIPQDIDQGRPGFLGIQFIGVFNFRVYSISTLKIGYKVFRPSRPILGIKYTVLNLGILHELLRSIIFGILEGLFQVFWYSTTPPPPPPETDPDWYGSHVVVQKM